MSTPLVQINDNLIINLFQTTRIRHNEGVVHVHMSDGSQEVLQGETAARFLTFARDVSDQMPTPTPVPEPGTNDRDFASILGEDLGTRHPAPESSPHGETPSEPA
jgi:hypothetical protein